MSAMDQASDLDPSATLRAFTDVLEAIDGVAHGTASLVVGGMLLDVTRSDDGVTRAKGQA